MIAAIDTNVLIDVFRADPKFGEYSAQTLRRCLQEGAIHACEVVWVETATVFPKQKSFLTAIQTLRIEFLAINQETAFVATKAWQNKQRA